MEERFRMCHVVDPEKVVLELYHLDKGVQLWFQIAKGANGQMSWCVFTQKLTE